MKFYVVESNKEKVNVRSKKCYSSDSLITAFTKYQILAKQKKSRYVYLIADFEDRRNCWYHKIKMEDNENNILPFFIVCQFDCLKNTDPVHTSRKDKTRIVYSDGFIQEFDDNFTAVKLYLMKRHECPDIEFCINYSISGTDGKETYSRTIDNSTRFMLFEHMFYTKRFKFDKSKIDKWEVAS